MVQWFNLFQEFGFLIFKAIDFRMFWIFRTRSSSNKIIPPNKANNKAHKNKKQPKYNKEYNSTLQISYQLNKIKHKLPLKCFNLLNLQRHIQHLER